MEANGNVKIMLPTVQSIIDSFICGPGTSGPLPESVKLWQVNFTVLYVRNDTFLYLEERQKENTYRVYW